jgi:hypothetical protein
MNMNAKMRRYGVFLGATAMCVLAGVVVSNATQTFSVPNSASYSYNLAPGANSAPITPPSNQAVLMLGSQTTVEYRGVAMATILHVPSSFIEWVGIESTNGAAITEGFSGIAGTHILYLDYSHLVDVEVAGSDTIMVHNANPSHQQTGTLELIW